VAIDTLAADTAILKAALESTLTFTGCGNCSEKALEYLGKMQVGSRRLFTLLQSLVASGQLPSNNFFKDMLSAAKEILKYEKKLAKIVDAVD